MDQDKRRQRELKRDIKQAGNRKRRRALARDLQENPEGAADAEFDYGRQSSQPLNGADDTSRKGAKGRRTFRERDEPEA
jgi:hypothetical protein